MTKKFCTSTTLTETLFLFLFLLVYLILILITLIIISSTANSHYHKTVFQVPPFVIHIGNFDISKCYKQVFSTLTEISRVFSWGVM